MNATRVALITGCSTGIGRATALHLRAQGWRVFATARRVETLDDLVSATLTPLYLDLTDHASCAAAVEAVLAQAGRIDALINNAGYGALGALEEVSLDEARLQFETNVFGTLRMCQLVAPTLRAQQGGRIINLSSAAGEMAYPIAGLYCASKAALGALSDTLRVELRPWNIKVVVVAPGIVRSAWFDNANRRAQGVMDNQASPYARLLTRYETLLPAITGPRMPGPEAVVRMIERALNARRPAPYYFGPGLFWSGVVRLGQALPLPWRDALLARIFWA